MRIVNARLGFANNSSSSHSMIVISKERYAQVATELNCRGEYGWGTFTLADAESKLDYLATAIWQHLSRQGDEVSAMVVVRDLLGLPEWVPGGYGIDHQSTFELPGSPDGGAIDVGFARAFAKWIQSEGVVVLGGNDNDGEHPMADGGDAMPFSREGSNPFVAKYDDASGTWTLFNRETGAKLRMAMDDGEALEMKEVAPGRAQKASAPDSAGGEPAKMGSPELVDVKITDYCDIGCAYCYQGSTVEGRHAKLENIKELAREFFKAGVLEVALGGGEPTRHPHFPEILEAFASQGIVANFTTRDLSFLKDPALSARVMANASSIAVSVSSLAQIEQAQKAWADSGQQSYSSRLTFQYVIGTASDKELRRMVAYSVKEHANLTLLGYKDSGRGLEWREGAGKALMLRESKVQSQSAGWMEMVQEAMGDRQKWARVCIDTALARECEAALGARGIPRALWHKSEGLVSMYVDAVAMAMGKSSYEDPSSMAQFDSGWLHRFAAWVPTSDEPARRRGGLSRG